MKLGKFYVTVWQRISVLYNELFEKKFNTYQRAKWHGQKIHPRGNPEEIFEKEKFNPSCREVQIKIGATPIHHFIKILVRISNADKWILSYRANGNLNWYNFSGKLFDSVYRESLVL